MSQLLPAYSPGLVKALRKDDARCQRAMVAIAECHGIPAQSISPLSGGSTIVYALDDRNVVKLFAPIYAADCERECSALAFLQGRTSTPTPELIAHGALEGWPYVIMSRLQGNLLCDVWDEIPRTNQLALCRQTGALLAELHELPLEGLAPTLILDWATFQAEQRRGCLQQQAKGKLEAAWCNRIDAYLATIPMPEAPRLAFLHTEMMREHLMVKQIDGQWRLSGYFDFEPSMTGDPEYDMGSIGLFFSKGDRALFRATVEGYGLDPENLDPHFSDRLMVHTLLHRYSNLQWYLEFMPGGSEATSLGELAQLWFAP